MKIEFENSIRRWNFLSHLQYIKIGWINPWSCMTSKNSKISVISSLIIDHITKNLFSSVRVYVLFLRTKRKIEYPKSRKKIQLGEDVSF